jgi:indole-3-glycerol phosphate synthase
MIMTILDTIVEHKRMEVMKRKARKPLDQLKIRPFYNREPLSPMTYFKDTEPNIIAEFKRRSPSKGVLSETIDPVPCVDAYMKAGAMAASVLTDRDFFGGTFRDLENVKSRVASIPLLRKDFMIDPYQVHEAKAYGADIILLIASILEKQVVKEMAAIAVSLGLSVLLEVHAEAEIEKWVPDIDMVGVNNRDLKNFSVDLEHSVALLPKLPQEAFKISESGLQKPGDVKMLYQNGFKGFLMGERFMVADAPGRALSEFIEQLKS